MHNSPNGGLGYMIQHFCAYCDYAYSKTNLNVIIVDPQEVAASIKAYKKEVLGEDFETPEEDKLINYPDLDKAKDLTGPVIAKPFADRIALMEAEIQTLKMVSHHGHRITLMLKVLKAFSFEEKFSRQKLLDDFSKTPEWKALFKYSLSESLASNVISVFAYLHVVKGLMAQNKLSYSKTKYLFMVFYIAAVSRSDFSGKSNQRDSMDGLDTSAFAGDDGDDMAEPNDSNPDSNKSPGSGDGDEAECDD